MKIITVHSDKDESSNSSVSLWTG